MKGRNALVLICHRGAQSVTSRTGGLMGGNGIVCASEHNLLVDAAVVAPFVAAPERNGAAVVREHETGQFAAAVFDDQHMRRVLHGVSATRLLEAPMWPFRRLPA
ncbi:MAG TPA: hypothetical protein VGL99_08465 [Chloroflexota bacterium]